MEKWLEYCFDALFVLSYDVASESMFLNLFSNMHITKLRPVALYNEVINNAVFTIG